MKNKAIACALLALSALGTAHAKGPYNISADGKEVTDPSTNLVWRRCPEGMTASKSGCSGSALGIDHAGAVKRAQSQAKGGWRLPNSQELLSIADESKFKMAIDTTAFPGTPAEHFWTTDPYGTDYFYAVNFYNGFRYDRYHTAQHHVRLVRNAQ